MMYRLPEEYRDELREPIGELITEEDLEEKRMEGKIVSVGDMVTASLKKHGIEPDISIIDYRIERKEYGDEMKEIMMGEEEIKKVSNPPGLITDELWNAIKDSYESQKKIRIEVDGEEDLAALPAIYLAPLGTAVLYGLPSRGIVFVKVGNDEKNKVLSFLKKMEE